MQSCFSAVGGIVRSTGPANITYVYVSTGPRSTFLSINGLLLISRLFIVILFRLLVPYRKFVVRSLSKHSMMITKCQTESKIIMESNKTEVKIVENHKYI